MNRYFTAILAIILLSSCCREGTETSKYLLTETEKAAIPYQTNDIIKFIHSDGYEFDFTVTNRQSVMRRSETEHCGDNYATFETLLVNVSSTLPELVIAFEVVPEDLDRFSNISINDKGYFQLNLSEQPDLDTLTINNTLYSNVYQSDALYSDSLIIQPKQLLFTKADGIIQITMTDDESFSIDE